MTNIANFASNITTYGVADGMVPSLPTFVASIVSLFILVLVVSYFAYFPVRDFVRARRKYIKDNIDRSEKANKDAQVILAKANEKLSHSKEKGQEIIKDFTSKANNEKNKIIESANNKASQIIEGANVRIKSDEIEMKNKLKDEISEIAMQAAEKLIKENISTDTNKKIIDEFIKELTTND